MFEIDLDSFSSGQIGSKLWLCQEAEKLFETVNQIWIYGGWYGLTAFLLKSRGFLTVDQIKSFDIDPSCESVADKINENWVWQNWQFKAFTLDCNTLSPNSNDVDLVINTSTEHFDSLTWWNNIPVGMTVILQGADMDHEDHVFKFSNLDEFAKTFQLSNTYYIGEKEFVYPRWSFKRFMLIGQK